MTAGSTCTSSNRPGSDEWLDVTYPRGILRHLDDIGFLSPRLAVAHGVQLTEPECELLAWSAG